MNAKLTYIARKIATAALLAAAALAVGIASAQQFDTGIPTHGQAARAAMETRFDAAEIRGDITHNTPGPVVLHDAPEVEDTTDPTRAEVVASLLTSPNTLDGDRDGVVEAGEQGHDCAAGAAGFELYVAADGMWACGER